MRNDDDDDDHDDDDYDDGDDHDDGDNGCFDLGPGDLRNCIFSDACELQLCDHPWQRDGLQPCWHFRWLIMIMITQITTMIMIIVIEFSFRMSNKILF